MHGACLKNLDTKVWIREVFTLFRVLSGCTGYFQMPPFLSLPLAMLHILVVAKRMFLFVRKIDLNTF